MYYGIQWENDQPNPSGLGLADITNPQSFNLYSYVLNNPLRNVDPDGLECIWNDGSFDSADDKQTGTNAGCSAAVGTYADPTAFGKMNAGTGATKRIRIWRPYVTHSTNRTTSRM